MESASALSKPDIPEWVNRVIHSSRGTVQLFILSLLCILVSVAICAIPAFRHHHQ